MKLFIKKKGFLTTFTLMDHTGRDNQAVDPPDDTYHTHTHTHRASDVMAWWGDLWWPGETTKKFSLDWWRTCLQSRPLSHCDSGGPWLTWAEVTPGSWLEEGCSVTKGNPQNKHKTSVSDSQHQACECMRRTPPIQPPSALPEGHMTWPVRGFLTRLQVPTVAGNRPV